MLDRAFANRRVEDRQVGFKDIPTEYPRKEAIDNSVKLGLCLVILRISSRRTSKFPVTNADIFG